MRSGSFIRRLINPESNPDESTDSEVVLSELESSSIENVDLIDDDSRGAEPVVEESSEVQSDEPQQLDEADIEPAHVELQDGEDSDSDELKSAEVVDEEENVGPAETPGESEPLSEQSIVEETAAPDPNLPSRESASSLVNAAFIITLAQELRTPISSLRVSYDLLKDPDALKDNPQEGKRLLENLERSIGRLERQASDLLEVGYIESGSLSLIKQPINASEPVLAAMDILRPTAGQRQVAIELDIDYSLPPVVADPFRLTQVLTHLLSNAMKFTPVRGTIAVEIGKARLHEGVVTREESDELLNALCVEVVDTGRGIPEAHIERIWEPFYRIVDEGTDSGSGVGLGLAIVKGLVELHDGVVWVESGESETKFGFAIPLV